MSMCVGQLIWQGGMQYALWSLRMYSRFWRRSLNSESEACVIRIPGSTGRWQDGIGRWKPSISTRHMRHAAAGASFSSSHSVGTSKPARCAARRIASPGIAVTSFPSIQIVVVGWPEGISPVCDTVGSCDSAGCVYRSSRLISRPPYRPKGRAAAGPVPGSGSRARLPVRSPPLAPSATDAAGQRLPRNPLPRATRANQQARTSWLNHRLVAARPHGLASSLRTSLLLDVDFVVVGELAHRCAPDRRGGDAEAAQREALHMRS